MALGKHLQIYVKTTGTCNLNCSHCFTSGSQGEKIFFNPARTLNFIYSLVSKNDTQSLRIVFHGGEPMLAPLKDLYDFYEGIEKLPIPCTYGIQTNLVYPLNEKKINFFNHVFKTGMGTSWDPDIRFGSVVKSKKEEQLNLWKKNVKILVSEGHHLTLTVCLSKYLVTNISPKDVYELASELGFKYLQVERITSDGNTVLNQDIRPSNKQVDDWIYQMYEETLKQGDNLKVKNMFLSELAFSTTQSLHVGNRCRNCEVNLITINADGTMAGCPNSATDSTWSDISKNPNEFIYSPQRVSAVCKEKMRKSGCYSCDLKQICNGDCYKLEWDEQCPAPMKTMRALQKSTVQKQKELLL